VQVGSILGAALDGKAAERYGCRVVIISAAIVFIVGAIGSAASPEMVTLCLSRCLLGVAVGLDHFGLVPSAFGCLQKLPLKYVKIDRQFIHDFPRQAYYLKTLCQIAQACDVDIIFEGVETEAQWRAALEAGAQAAQGYWLAQPVSKL